MKTLFVLFVVLGSFSAAQAAEKICPASTTENFLCKSDAALPWYPFVALCSDAQDQHVLAVDPGGLGSPGAAAVTAHADSATTSYVVTSQDDDGMTLVVPNTIAQGQAFKAVLTYSGTPGGDRHSYTCHVR